MTGRARVDAGPTLYIVAIEIGRRTACVPDAAAGTAAIDGRVREQVAVVDELLHDDAFADDAEPEAGAHRDDTERSSLVHWSQLALP